MSISSNPTPLLPFAATGSARSRAQSTIHSLARIRPALQDGCDGARLLLLDLNSAGINHINAKNLLYSIGITMFLFNKPSSLFSTTTLFSCVHAGHSC
jgi:hypothetical protein